MREVTRLVAVLVILALAGCGSHAGRAPAARLLDRARPTGTLYLADAAPGYLTVLDVASGRAHTRRLAELSPGDPPYTLAISGGRLVVFGGERTYAFDLALREPAQPLGESLFFLPAAAAGRVWLALVDPTSPDTVRALRGVRQVTVRGRVILARSARPPHWPLAALDTGLVLQATSLELWDPVTGRIIRSLPGLFPVASRGSLLVSCGQSACPVLYVTDTRRRGRTQAIAPGPGFRFQQSYGGVFSPDGATVAVPAATRDGKPRVAVVELRSGRARLIDGASLGGNQQMAWSASGWLYFYAGAGRLAAYRPSAARAVVLPGRVRPFIKMVAS